MPPFSAGLTVFLVNLSFAAHDAEQAAWADLSLSGQLELTVSGHAVLVFPAEAAFFLGLCLPSPACAAGTRAKAANARAMMSFFMFSFRMCALAGLMCTRFRPFCQWVR